MDRPTSKLRVANLLFRSVHILSAAAVGGALLVGSPVRGHHGWWIVAAASGGALLAAEFLQHPRLYREVCGASTLVKLVLLAAIPMATGVAPWLVGAAFVAAALGAHAPKGWRHRRWF